MSNPNFVAVSMLLFSAITILAVEAKHKHKTTWANRVVKGNEVITTLQFYFHDKLSTPNPSVVTIIQPSQTIKSSYGFGLVNMADNPLTVTPDPTSKLVGRARGMYGSAGQADLALIMVLNYGFIDGMYNGSSFSLLSINPALQSPREMAIVGGTGLFRLARGYAIANTYSFDGDTTGDAIVGYNVTIVTPRCHY